MATPEEMANTMRANMLEKTGKTLEQWLAIVSTASLDKHGKIVSMLKTDHSVTHGFANLIAHDFLNQGVAEEPDLIEAQYTGAKSDLKPIYDAIMRQLSSLPDIEIAPKKAYVSLRRNKQFAIIQPSTKTRLDVGINLKGESPTERLEASGSFNAMVSHRVRLTSVDDVDEELIGWLTKAYENA